jgi:hypothetical protein
MPVNHLKTNNIADWTQAELDAQIALGNYPSGTVLADITLPSDWNAEHTNPQYILTAGENITAGSLVYIANDGEGYLASNTTEICSQRLLGVATETVLSGANLAVQTSAEMTTGSWNVNTDPSLYLGVNGAISQGYPTTPNYSQKIGFVISSTEIFIRIHDYIVVTPSSFALLESGDFLLLENNDKLLLEAA